MPQNSQNRKTTRTAHRARVAAVMMALGVLALSLVGAETAAAATGVVVSTNKTAKQGTYPHQRQDALHAQAQQDELRTAVA